MNQRLQNAKLAAAVVGAMLLFGLLSAQPAGGDGHAAARSGGPHGPTANLIAGEIGNDLAQDINRRARHLEGELAAAGSAGGTLAWASAMLASSLVEASLVSALEDLGPRRTAHQDLEPTPLERPARSHSAAMAMPYFSTARSQHSAYGE